MLFVIAFFLSVSAGFAADQEIKIQYEFCDFAKAGCDPEFELDLKKSAEKPEGSWNLPSLNAELPVYALIELGDDKRLLVLDQKDSNDPFYNVLYFDANGNQDLTDDPIVEKAPPTDDRPHGYVVKDVTLNSGTGSYDYAFFLGVEYKGRQGKKITESGVKRSLKLHMEPCCWYRGVIDIEGRPFRIAVMDQNLNGRFDDRPAEPDLSALKPGATIELEGDGIYMTSNETIDASYSLAMSDVLVIGSVAYALDLDVGARTMRLTFNAGQAGELIPSMPTEQFVLFNTDTHGVVSAYEPADRILLPPGPYRLYTYRTLKKDGRGGLWALAACSTREAPEARVMNGTQSILNFGEPFIPFAEVPEWSIQGIQKGFSQQASVEFVIEGAGKERVIDLIRLSGKDTNIALSKEEKNRPREPEFKVVDPEGKVVVEDHFKYG